mmetsp:Transcript_3384/g.8423  ORF Transcript_3384/g.8423 Transcript_3384/m.8423 type:complete len:228 (-) Transcript_3384:14-697(-)
MREIHQCINRALIYKMMILKMVVPVLDPRMFECLGGCKPHLRIDQQKVLHKVKGMLRYFVPCILFHRILAVSDRVFSISTSKRHVANQQDECDDAQAPHVALVRIALLCKYLWSKIGERPTRQRHFRVGRPYFAEAEINKLQLVAVLLLIQEVLQLQVSMHNMMSVNIVYCQQHLPHCICSILFIELSPLGDSIEELSTLHALHNQVQSIIRLIDIHKPCYVGMVQG